MDDDAVISDLTALRAERMASDAEYITQLEALSLGQERKLGLLRAVAEAARPLAYCWDTGHIVVGSRMKHVAGARRECKNAAHDLEEALAALDADEEET